MGQNGESESSARQSHKAETVFIELVQTSCERCGRDVRAPFKPVGDNAPTYCLDCILREQSLR